LDLKTRGREKHTFFRRTRPEKTDPEGWREKTNRERSKRNTGGLHGGTKTYFKSAKESIQEDKAFDQRKLSSSLPTRGGAKEALPSKSEAEEDRRKG